MDNDSTITGPATDPNPTYRLPWRPYPTGLLPETLRKFVDRGSESIGCDPAYLAMPSLGVLASLIGNSVRLILSTTWWEPPILWLVAIGRSGTIKSPGYDLAVEPLRRLQDELVDLYHDDLALYKRDKIKYDAELSRWKKHAEDDPPEEPVEPVLRRLHTSDTTIEGLALILRDGRGSILVARDEMAALFGSFYRYHRGSDASQWIECYYAQPLIIDRKTSATIYVPSAAVSIIGTVQPGTARRCFTPELYESGFVARVRMAYPPPRAKQWSDRQLEKEIEAGYRRIVRRLFELRDSERRDIPLHPDALPMWKSFVDEHGLETFDAADEDVSAMLAKTEGVAARFALLFEVIKWAEQGGEGPGPSTVSVESLEAGIALSEWHSREEERIYAVLSDPEVEIDRTVMKPPSQREKSESTLLECLGDGASVPSRDLEAVRVEAGISPRTWARARKSLGVLSVQVRTDNGKLVKEWRCRLPRQKLPRGTLEIVGTVDPVGTQDQDQGCQEGQEGQQIQGCQLSDRDTLKGISP